MARLKPLWLHLTDLVQRTTRSPRLALACDYDGTLTAIAPHPSQADLPDRTRAVLTRLSQIPDVSLAILSGRGLDDLRQVIRLDRVFLAGAAGLEILDESGHRETLIGPDERVPHQLKTELEQWCARFEGAWIEDKGLAFAVHYRAVPLAHQPAFGAGVRRRIREHARQVVAVHGKRVFEVMPGTAPGKAAVLERWRATQPPEATVLFFGDDTNDEPVHQRVREHGGWAVAVGRPVSRAEYALASPQELTWFLEWIEREWSARGATSDSRALERVEASEA